MFLKKFQLLCFVVLRFACFGQIPSYIPLDSLQAFYPFTQNVIGLNDVGPAAYHGVSSQPVLYSADRNGLAQQAIQGGAYLDLSGAVMNFNYNQSFSISFWCTKPANASQSASLFSTSEGSNSNFEIDYDGASGNLIFQFGDATYALQAQMADTNWHQYTYVYNHANTIAQLYVDGEILTGTSIFSSQILQYGAIARIGSKANIAVPTIFFSGKYDDFGFWRRVLNPCEIRSIYNDQFQFSYLSAGPDLNICAGQEAFLCGQNAISALWNNGVINCLPFVPSTGYYVLSGLDYNECPGTDSLLIIVIPEILSSISISSCDPVSYYNLNLVNSGNFQIVITAVSGCDSIVNIDFQRLTPPLVSTPSIAGSFLLTDQSSNYAYQWYTCTTDTPIPGANDYLFEVTDASFYYVVATNSCGSDTTDCVSIPEGSINQNQQISISVNPNPVSTTLFVSGLSKNESKEFLIFNGFGQICLQSKIENDAIDISGLPTGFYFLHLGEQVLRFVKSSNQ
jgi:glutaredoxin-related protein